MPQRPAPLAPKTDRLPHRQPILRKACTLVAILGAGLVAGALLGEASMMSFSLTLPHALQSHSIGYPGNVNGYLPANDSPAQSRRPVSQPRGLSGHHLGL